MTWYKQARVEKQASCGPLCTHPDRGLGAVCGCADPRDGDPG